MILRQRIWISLVGVLIMGLTFSFQSQRSVLNGTTAAASAGQANPANSAPSIVLPSPISGATSDPSIAIDASGRRHVAYGIALGSEVIYATCAANCHLEASWTSVAVGTKGRLGSRPIIELTASGQPRLMYLRDDGGFSTSRPLIYNACDSNCTSAASWTELEIIANVVFQGLFSDFPFFALDPQGRPRAAIRSSGSIAYLACDANCAASASNWTITPLNVDGLQPTIAIDAAGNPHVLYQKTDRNISTNNDILDYATCAQNCTDAANWSIGSIFLLGIDFRDSYAIDTDSSNRPRIAFFTGNLATNEPAQANALIYAWCDSVCEDGTNWSGVLVGTAQGEGVAPDLLLDANNRPHISYYNDASGYELGYATCAANCESTAGNWTTERVESPLGYPSVLGPGCSLSSWYATGPISLALDLAGKPQIVFVARNLQTCGITTSERLRLVRFIDLGATGSTPTPTTGPGTPTPTTGPGTPTPPPAGTPTPPVERKNKLFVPLATS
jgi:hypothetical protein